MEPKHVESYPIFFHSQKATIADLPELTRDIPPKLFREIEKTGAKSAGPISFLYYGMDGDPQTEFQLEIALPVDQLSDWAGEYSFKMLPPFKCVTTVLKGPWDQLSKAYEKLVSETMQAGLSLMFESRELYHNILTAEQEQRKSFTSPDNVTEIQMRIQ